jgi:crotonobetainyl-CoA:carnitine CoA-transferase CaiB-like acyl-CoA transferase
LIPSLQTKGKTEEKTEEDPNMQRPLEGIRVLDCGIYHAGPGGPAILGDLGAEVIKMECPGVGDPIRGEKTIGSISFEIPGGRSIFCEGANRNKKSITIDLTTKKGQEVLYRLVGKSDVFLTNMRRPVVESMNITYPILRQTNPQIIYATVSAFGPEGPDRDRGGFDYQGQARSGFMYSMGEADMPPLVCQFGIIDQATAIMASHQIITALYMRERCGVGQEVHISILGTAISLLYFNVLMDQMGGFEPPRHRRSTEQPLRNYYKCSDEKWLMMTLTPQERHWGPLCRALDHPELENDSRFDTSDKRLDNAEQLVGIFDKVFITRPLKEWLRIFGEYDLFCCAINSLKDLKNDPQVTENHYLVDFEHPTLGVIKIPGYPGHFSESLAGTISAAPELGEHTEDVLTKIGGYSSEEIAQLREEGII